MSFKDWFNYMFKKLVWYLETPKEERDALKNKDKHSWDYTWFGLVPFSIKLQMDKARKRFNRS